MIIVLLSLTGVIPHFIYNNHEVFIDYDLSSLNDEQC